MPELEKDAPLTDQQGMPLRLFLQDGRPVTDERGVPLLNICGNMLFTTSKDKAGREVMMDLRGSLLTDWMGRTAGEDGYEPSGGPAEERSERQLPEGQVFAADGHPLTDREGRPLVDRLGRQLLVFSPRGNPVSDAEGRRVIDVRGQELHGDERPYLSQDRRPLRAFDHLGRPITDEAGFPLTDLIGFPLILADPSGKPMRTVKGYSLKDADGLMPWQEGYDLTKTPKYSKMFKVVLSKNKVPSLAFDSYGHPLTDMYGFPLFDLKGMPLLRKLKNSWVDSYRNPAVVVEKPVYDSGSLGRLINSKGVPVQLYDRRGYPLTDEEGVPLATADGLILLRFNEKGEPFSDAWGHPPVDLRGNQFGSPQFKPCKSLWSVSKKVAAKRDFKVTGEQLFDVHGMPLTDRQGIPLSGINQDLLVRFAGLLPRGDILGRFLYDALSLPLVQSFDKSLKSPTGAPIRLFNKEGKPLTDKDGKVLFTVRGVPLVRRNFIGKIESDYKGSPLFDADGCPSVLQDQFSPTKRPPNEELAVGLRNIDGTPLQIYHLSGEPLTDSEGRILFNNNGTPLLTIDSSGIIQGKTGEFISDQQGFTKIKISGRRMREKVALYDKNDRPLIGPSGFVLRLRNGQELLKFDKCGYPMSTFDNKPIFDSNGRQIFTPSSDMFLVLNFDQIQIYDGKIQIFDCEDRPLLDITGNILYSSRGVRLIELSEDGTPRSDALGRPIFDEKGIPMSNPGGVWRDQSGNPYRLYDREGNPVTDPRGKELVNIYGEPLVVKDTFGRPYFDRKNQELYDSNGRKITSGNFSGTTAPQECNMTHSLEWKGIPLRLFDSNGSPLTDECGKPLMTCFGIPLLDMTKGLDKMTDINGGRVYDERRLPLGCDGSSPILTMKGEPVMLYNRDKNPLTGSDGRPTRRADGSPLLELDSLGRPVGAEGSPLYDHRGALVDSREAQLAGISAAQPVPYPPHGVKPVLVYDKNGMPLTDDHGNTLFTSDGRPLQAGSWGDVYWL